MWPLYETTDIIMNSLFNENDKVLGFDKMYLKKKLLDITTKENLFWFNGKLFKHIEEAH